MKKLRLFLLLCICFSNSLFAGNPPKFYHYLPQIADKFIKQNDTLWVNISGNGIQKRTLSNKVISTFEYKTIASSVTSVGAFYLGDKSLWAIFNSGIGCYDGKKWLYFSMSNQTLKSNTVNKLLIKDSIVYALTDKGISVFKHNKFEKFILLENGLTYTNVTDGIIDTNNVAWFCMNSYTPGGISKYNGDTAITYNKTKGLKSNYVNSAFLDNADTLWIGTDGYGVSKYIAKLDTFVTYGTLQGLSSVYIKGFYQNKFGLWTKTSSGLSRYLPKTGKFKSYAISSSTFRNFELNSQDTLVLITDNEVLKYDSLADKFVSKYKTASGQTIQSAFLDGVNTHLLQNISFITISDNKITKNDSLVGGYAINAYDKINLSNSTLFATTLGIFEYASDTLVLKTDGIIQNGIDAITTDKDSTTWFAYSKGLISSKTIDNKWTLYSDKDGLIKDDYYTDIISTSKGEIWALTEYDGALKFKNGKWIVYDEKSSPIFQSPITLYHIKSDKKGDLWIASSKGLIHFDGTTWELIGNEAGKPFKSIHQLTDLTIDVNGNVWAIGQDNINGKYIDVIAQYFNNTWKVYSGKDIYYLDKLHSIIIDKNNAVWVSSTSTYNTLICFKDNAWSNLSNQVPEPFPFYDPSDKRAISNMTTDNDSVIWMETGTKVTPLNDLIISYDGTSWKYYTKQTAVGQEHLEIESMSFDYNNNIWLSSINGAFLIDKELNVNFTSDTVCQGNVTTFKNTSEPTKTWAWDVNNDGKSEFSSQDITYTFPKAGTYDVKLTVSDGKDTNWIVKQVIVKALPMPTISAQKTSLCLGQSTSMNLNKLYEKMLWNVGNVKTFSFVTDTAGTFTVTVTDANACQNTASLTITKNTNEMVTISGKTEICKFDTTEISVSPFVSYLWNTGEKTKTIKASKSDDYTVTVVDVNGCQYSKTHTLTVLEPYAEQIGVVTVSDKNQHVIVAWNKTANKGTAYYNIYRKTLGGYDTLAILPASHAGLYADTESDFRTRSYTYKITTTDKCGNESPLEACTPHTTMHLLMYPYNKNFQLSWTPYMGLPVQGYIIYECEADGTNLQVKEELSDINTSYTIMNYDANKHYRVGIALPDSVFPKKLKSDSGPFSQSLSNMAESELTDIAEFNSENTSVYPTVTSDVVNVILPETIKNADITITDVLGKTVLKNKIETIGNINVSSLTNGVYYIKVEGETLQTTKKFIKQ